ncbi:uncharacterized protein BJX67DRAFT_229918 [Aspergillus lucknowensis]|uniref:Knr4/Smi1-like domain-containing protein n=1 Tax=Aspergillus lucknowensis TaxID=176173 RepID=A0ABR4LHW0_9EURO
MADISTDEAKRLLEQKYGFQFPPDFFRFKHFFDTHSDLIRDTDIGMSLDGPYDLLADPSSTDDQLSRARHYNDPPEFITIATGHTDGLHWGYYLDDPANPPFAIASYFSNDAFELSVVGDTLFHALREQIELFHRDNLDYARDDPGDADSYREKLGQLAQLREALSGHPTGDRKEVGNDYTVRYGGGKTGGAYRQAVAMTRDGMGIVVAGEQYRALSGEDIFQAWNASPTAQEVEGRKEEALRLLGEGYPGAALKLGKDLWIWQQFRQSSYSLLDAAYTALDRPLLSKNLKEAVSNREFWDSQ